MKRYAAILVLLTFTLLPGCRGVEAPKVQEPEVDAPPVLAAATPPASQEAAAKPQWVYTSTVRVTGLTAPTGRPELVLSTSEGGRTSLLRLDAAGRAVGSPLQLPGALGESTPDFVRFLAVSGGKVSVLDLAGKVLWEGEVSSGKGRPAIHLLPNGSALVMTLLTEAGEGVQTHTIDLTGKSLWKIDGPDAGEFAGASAEELFFWNNQSLWRIQPDGTGRKELLSKEQRAGSTQISADGSTIVVVGESGGKIYDHAGKPVADLPGGKLHTVTSGGQRILVEQNGTYVLFDRQGKAIWKVAATPQTYIELAADGAWFLTAVKSASRESLQVALYDAAGKLAWESTVDIALENRAASLKTAMSPDMKLAFVAAGKQVFAWSLSGH